MKRQITLIAFIYLLLFSSAFSQTVYVTKSGNRYHVESCRYLTNSTKAIDLTDAVNKNYTPCKVCKPTQSEFTPTEETQEKVQCSALTKKKKRCKRITKSANGKCWQHGGN